MAIKEKTILQNYQNAQEVYASYGVDTQQALDFLQALPVSLHNWQDDDVRGFEGSDGLHSENVVTGNYPGRAQNGEQMRQDYEQAFQWAPWERKKINLHSMYAEPQGKKERSQVETKDFRTWIDWAKARGFGMDFNVSYFTHRMMKDGCSLASPDKAVREYWITAGIGGRKIASDMGRELGQLCINNTWVPDGSKDMPADRAAWRARLTESLDRILEKPYPRDTLCDVVEGKVFGIGSESFVVGSHDYYLAYAIKKGIGITMDTGHYHPQESVADKVTAVYPFVDYLMLHLTRGLRWDSDHVLIQDDPLRDIILQLKRSSLLDKKVGLGLDYFDATINRVGAWIIGLRALAKTVLEALLEPTHLLLEAEAAGNNTRRLALMDDFRNLPYNAVWDYLCHIRDCGVGSQWIDRLEDYEKNVQSKR